MKVAFKMILSVIAISGFMQSTQATGTQNWKDPVRKAFHLLHKDIRDFIQRYDARDVIFSKDDFSKEKSTLIDSIKNNEIEVLGVYEFIPNKESTLRNLAKATEESINELGRVGEKFGRDYGIVSKVSNMSKLCEINAARLSIINSFIKNYRDNSKGDAKAFFREKSKKIDPVIELLKKCSGTIDGELTKLRAEAGKLNNTELVDEIDEIKGVRIEIRKHSKLIGKVGGGGERYRESFLQCFSPFVVEVL